MDINECLEKGYLIRIKYTEDLVKKEFEEAGYDLDKAGKALQDKDFKWCIIKAYYCLFHSAKAILFKLGYREKKHFAIAVVLEDLSSKGKLESKYIDYFNAAESSREGADYHYVHTEEIAEHSLQIAKDFYNKMREMKL